MNNLHLLTLIASLAFAGAAQAQTETFSFDLVDSSTGVKAVGSITGTYTSPGVYTGTSGDLTATIGGTAYTSVLAPAEITIHDISPPAGSVDLFGADNLIGINYLSQNGTLFTNPGTTQSETFSAPEDVFALSTNSSNTGYELDWLGTDFPGTPWPYNADTGLKGSITEDNGIEAPEPSSWTLVLIATGVVIYLRRRAVCV